MEKKKKKLADTSFDSTYSSSSKTKQREGNKNIIELKKEKVNDEESNSDESIDAKKQFFVFQIHKERELTKAGTGKICVQGRKKRVYKTLQEPELSMMTDFIYKDVWRRMKKLNNTAAGDCAHDVLNHVGITDSGECHF